MPELFSIPPRHAQCHRPIPKAPFPISITILLLNRCPPAPIHPRHVPAKVLPAHTAILINLIITCLIRSIIPNIRILTSKLTPANRWRATRCHLHAHSLKAIAWILRHFDGRFWLVGMQTIIILFLLLIRFKKLNVSEHVFLINATTWFTNVLLTLFLYFYDPVPQWGVCPRRRYQSIGAKDIIVNFWQR